MGRHALVLCRSVACTGARCNLLRQALGYDSTLFDICAEPSETGMAVKALQALLPRARVLYSSATGASEPTNLAYMTRIGSWGFRTMLDMIRTLGRC